MRAASEVTLQAYMVGPSGVLRKALFSRGVAARLVAVRGLLYMIIQQLRTMDEGEAEDAMEADPELSCSQVHFTDVNLLWLVLVSCTANQHGSQRNSTMQWRLTETAHVTCALLCMHIALKGEAVQKFVASLHCGMCPVNPTQPYPALPPEWLPVVSACQTTAHHFILYWEDNQSSAKSKELCTAFLE